jgi:hypothetical protein
VSLGKLPSWFRQSTLEALEEIEIPLPAHPRRAQKILDDENGNFVISGNNKRTCNAGFGIDQMVSPLTVEDEAFPFKNCGQSSVRDWPKSGHQRTLAISRSSATNSGASQESPFLL